MPTYEYRCKYCGHEFEAEQRITAPPLRLCVECGKDGAARTISAVSFVLRGSGWYADGYARTTSQPSNEASGSERLTGEHQP